MVSAASSQAAEPHNQDNLVLPQLQSHAELASQSPLDAESSVLLLFAIGLILVLSVRIWRFLSARADKKRQ